MKNESRERYGHDKKYIIDILGNTFFIFSNRGATEETGLSGILDLKSGQSSKGSKLESALDKLGLQKRKVN